MNSVASDLLRWSDQTPDAAFLTDVAGSVHTYRTIAQRTRCLAGGLLDLGVRPADRILVVLPNGLDYVTAYYGTLLAGATAVCLPTGTTQPELAYIIEHCDPKLVITETDLETVERPGGGTCESRSVSSLLQGDSFLDPPLGGADGIAQIIYTSGTTGDPKGVMLSHRALRANTSGIVEYLHLSQRDRVGVALDFVYSYGNSLLQTHCRVGGSLALLGGLAFPAQAVDLLDERRCTGISGVPSTFALLLRRGRLEGRNLSDLRYLTCAGGGLPVENVRRLRLLLPHVEVFLMYGQTEAAARLSYLPPEQLDRRPTSIGKGMPGVKLEVLSPEGHQVEVGVEGEIVASGQNLMSGYWRDSEGTQRVLRGGKLWTGDLATIDAEGFISVTGRRSELIKTGAYRVHPKEIEDAIVSMEGVLECVVVGVPHEIWGESIVACFPADGGASLTDVRLYLKDRLPEYKWPRDVAAVATIPRTASGKPRRRALREMLQRDGEVGDRKGCEDSRT